MPFPLLNTSFWNDIEEHGEIMQDAAGQNKEMPDGVAVRQAAPQIKNGSSLFSVELRFGAKQ